MRRSRSDLYRTDRQLRLPIRTPVTEPDKNDPVSGSVISLFSGAGGLDLGVEQAGFRTVAAVEWDDDAADSMEKNRNEFFPELREVVRGNLYPLATGAGEGITTRDILKAGGLSSRNRPELLIGGPPCVAFSKSGFWLDWKREVALPGRAATQTAMFPEA